MLYLLQHELDPFLFRQTSADPAWDGSSQRNVIDVICDWVESRQRTVIWEHLGGLLINNKDGCCCCITRSAALIGWRYIQSCPEAFRSVAIDNAPRILKTVLNGLWE